MILKRMKALSKQVKTHVECVCVHAWENMNRGHSLYETPIFFTGSASNFLFAESKHT